MIRVSTHLSYHHKIKLIASTLSKIKYCNKCMHRFCVDYKCAESPVLDTYGI